MKKCFTIIIALFFSVIILKGQTTGGPDAFGYVWRNNSDTAGQAYSWIDITALSGATQIQGLGDDNTIGPFPIGFAFHYYWYDVSNFWVGSNGYIGFTNRNLAAPFPTIPFAGNPQDYIAGFAADLMFDATNNAQCWKWTNTAADTLIVSYIDVPFYDASGPAGVGLNTFQIILSAVDSSITVNYHTQTGSSATAANSTIGIENNSGSVGLLHSKNIYPTGNTTVKYFYPKSTTYAVNDAATVFNDNPTTGGKFLAIGDVFTMNTSVENSGNQPLSAFNVYSHVRNNALADLVRDTATTTALNPGQSQNFTMTKTWTNTTTGTYSFITETLLSGDATPSNNIITQELVVIDTGAYGGALLSYDNGFDSGSGGLNWTGGNGGAGMYFVPPFYPCNVSEMLAYIVGAGSYSMILFDDNGGNGTPGTMLDSIYMDSINVQAQNWNISPLTSYHRIDSGGVYVLWLMNGTGATLGQNTSPPYSNRGYEYINGVWAPYRGSESEDLMINMKIGSLYVGTNENEVEDYFGNFYPNPTSTIASINYSVPQAGAQLTYNIYDMQGRQVASTVSGLASLNGRINIDVNSYSPGVYYCMIQVNNKAIVRKLVVTK